MLIKILHISRSSNHNGYWALDKELERCYHKSKKKHYQGKETRLIRRIKLLEQKKVYHDYLRWTILPKAIIKAELTL